MVGAVDTERALWFMLAGSRGGATRARILRLLREHPRNTNQVATSLGIDYKTAEYNLRVLRKHRIIAQPFEGSYGATHHLSRDVEAIGHVLDAILEKVAPEPTNLGKPENTNKGDEQAT